MKSDTLRQSTAGFTLLELLIVISVTMALFGIAVASFNTYNKKERVRQAALNLKSDLRFAQTRAISAEKPDSSCTTFIGMRITFTSSGYTIRHQCSEGFVGAGDSITFPAGITFSPQPTDYTYMVLTRRASLASDQTIVITNGTQNYAVEVTSEGEINDHGFQ